MFNDRLHMLHNSLGRITSEEVCFLVKLPLLTKPHRIKAIFFSHTVPNESHLCYGWKFAFKWFNVRIHEILRKVSCVKKQEQGHPCLNSKLSISEQYNCIAVDERFPFLTLHLAFTNQKLRRYVCNNHVTYIQYSIYLDNRWPLCQQSFLVSYEVNLMVARVAVK